MNLSIQKIFIWTISIYMLCMIYIVVPACLFCYLLVTLIFWLPTNRTNHAIRKDLLTKRPTFPWLCYVICLFIIVIIIIKVEPKLLLRCQHFRNLFIIILTCHTVKYPTYNVHLFIPNNYTKTTWIPFCPLSIEQVAHGRRNCKDTRS